MHTNFIKKIISFKISTKTEIKNILRSFLKLQWFEGEKNRKKPVGGSGS